MLHWYRPFKTVRSGGFATGDVVWFPEGGLNAAYNCIDRWAFTHPEMVIIYEADEPGEDAASPTPSCSARCVPSRTSSPRGSASRKATPSRSTSQWQAAAALLACARIGAIHSVVFAVFSAEEEGWKGDCDEGDCGCGVEGLSRGLVLRRTGGRLRGHEEVAKVPSYCPPQIMAAEDPLFILYVRLLLLLVMGSSVSSYISSTLTPHTQTSGPAGKPKGVVHTTGGYLLCAALSVKYVFDVHPGDRFACMAHVGWIMGHTYITYGSSSTASPPSCLMFESTVVYPSPA
ncbi:acetyl-CoA synthetase [Mycena leptocephala]|nr:acetyl-CoA synthetase [Mycena leptocephala]